MSKHTYTVSGTIMVGVYTVVESDIPLDHAEVKRIAEERGTKGLCHYCTGSKHDENLSEWCLSDGLGDTAVDAEDVSEDDQ